MGARRPVGQWLRYGLLIAAAALLVATEANAQTFTVQGACRDGVPHGAWQLTDAKGRLRVLGAFNRGKRTGSFIYWNASGVRIAHMPYEEDARNGTLALWYQTPTKGLDAQQRLEAVYTSGQLNGFVRIWNPDGRVRGEYLYAGGQLAGAKAWDARGRELSEAQARAQAEKRRRGARDLSGHAGIAGRETRAGLWLGCAAEAGLSAPAEPGATASIAVHTRRPLTRCGKPRKMTTRPLLRGRLPTSIRGDPSHDHYRNAAPRRARRRRLRPPARAPGRRRAGPQDRDGRRRHFRRSALLQPVPEQQHRRAHLRQARADGRGLADDPGHRHVVEGARRQDLGVQAAQGREVPRRLGAHGRGRRVLDRPGRADPEQPRPVRRVYEGDRGQGDPGSVHDPLQDGRAAPVDAERPVDDLHRQQEGRDRRVDGGLQQRQGDDRQRPLQVRALRQRRSRRARAQR